MLKLKKSRAAVFMHNLDKLAVAGNILIVIKMKLDRWMLDAQRVFNSAGFHGNKADSPFSQRLIISFSAFSNISGWFDKRRSISSLYNSVSRRHFPDPARFYKLFK